MRPQSTPSRQDQYSAIADRIIGSLEDGRIPWRMPWNPAVGGPVNALSLKAYRGINPIMLALTAQADSYSDPRWLTYKQARKAAGNVRKGEHGTRIVFWNWSERENASGERESYAFLKLYTVFNVAQCADLDLPPLPTREPVDPLTAAESIIGGFRNRPSIADDGGGRAFYAPATDSIHLPKRSAFESSAGYYATLFHEFGHGTGHPKRLGRFGDHDTAPFGCDSYAKEELVAEFTAAFVCGAAGIADDRRIENTSAYVQSWIAQFKTDKRLAVQAAAQAQKAADLVLNRADHS